MLYQTLSPMLERETGLPVLGVPASYGNGGGGKPPSGPAYRWEIKDLAARLCAVAAVLEETLDWPRFLR